MPGSIDCGLYASGVMESHGDYRIDIERRATGAPKFRVTVLIDEKNVGTDYAATAQQADHLAKRMIQRHQELHRQLRGF
jgi:dsRNA-specific ribonuclease